MSQQVKLYVYDLTQGMAKHMSLQFLGARIDGVWHTGIVVYGNEYFYGGGITYDSPGRTPFGTPVQIVDLGTTSIPLAVFHEFLSSISPRFSMVTYDIFNNNCNNFTNEASLFLVGKGIPSKIIDLPNEFLRTPLGQSLRPLFQQMQNTLSNYHGANNITAQRGKDESIFPVVPTMPKFNATEKLKFVHLTDWSPVTFHKGNLNAIRNKLLENIAKAGISLTQPELATLDSLCGIAEKGLEIRNVKHVPEGSYVLIEKITTLSEELIFPSLDLFRFLIINPIISQYYIKKVDLINDLFTRFGKKTGVSNNPRIMITRLAANLFAYPSSGTFMVSHPQVEVLMTAFVNVINAEDVKCKSAAAVMVHNMSLYLARDDSDMTSQAISSILYQLPQENDEQTLYYLLLALGRLLYGNQDGVSLCLCLEFDVQKYLANPSTLIKEIAQDIASLIQTTVGQ